MTKNQGFTKPPPSSPEGKTRLRVDRMLEEAGWIVIKERSSIPDKGNFAVEEVETESGPMDYGLIINGVLVGDIETKPEETRVPGIISQDERYSKAYKSDNFDFDGYHIPFLYSSNGHVIYWPIISKNR